MAKDPREKIGGCVQNVTRVHSPETDERRDAVVFTEGL